MYLAVASWLGSFARSPQITGSNTAVARCPDKFMHENFSLQNMSSVWTMKSKVLKISFISTNLSSAENHQKKSFEIFFESDKNLIKSDFISTKTSQKNNERSSRWIKVISWTIFWYFLNYSSFNTFPPPAFVCVTILLVTTTTSAATFVRFNVLTKCSEKREKKQEKTFAIFLRVRFRSKRKSVKLLEQFFPFLLWYVFWPEWPDAELKSCPIFSNSCPKTNLSGLTWKMLLFTLGQKFTIHLGYFW